MNKKIFSLLLAVGSIAVLLSSVLVMESVAWGKYFFAAGAALYIFGRLQMKYTGENYKIKRLNRQIYLSAILLIGTCYLQFKGNNSWVVLLLITALNELYCTLRMSWYEKNS